ncbi:alpha/beta fold hydrolase [Flavobacterium sp. F-328]|uniref:Alpha/beta fold hydrolase n=1 Tax=Flavobacterium erciyesense TaxID=2825842 RepID=A0ABS5D4V9_9FLAO|nr:alpha/beta fold hydrolase [Flavobacterium erciyesense]MBQ0909059.1 alpha/beta fold hydrolase [Flavobacterium erciyesense]
MKKLLISSLLLLATIATQAQMDDKFYYPKKAKTITIDSLQFKEQNYFIEKDTINTIVLSPKQKAKQAVVLYFQGAGGNCMNYAGYVKPLVNDGYTVIMISMRGYGKSSGKPTHLNIAADAQTVFNEIQKNPDFKNKKIIIYGASMGTQVAVNLTKNNQDKISGLIVDGVISSFTEIAVSKTPEAQHQMIRMYVTSPYSAAEDIKNIQSVPVLFIHSKTDKDVPFSQCETVFNNTKSKKELWIYEGDHLQAPKLYPSLLVEKTNALLKL